MVWAIDRTAMELGIKARRLMHNHPELENAEVLIFHCPFDCLMLEKVDKPSILYEHLEARLVTFMFDEVIKRVDPIKRLILIHDRPYVLEKFKWLFSLPDIIVCNSKFIRQQMKEWFDIDAYVVYPPVNLKKFKPTTKNPKRTYFLSVQRVNWQKRIDLQIRAFAKTKEKLVIVGSIGEKVPNPDLKRLCSYYPNIEYVGPVSDRTLAKLYTNAKAVIQTGFYEDFGLVPVEGFACGTPAIVVDEGGFRETVHSPELGIRIKPPYEENLVKAVESFNPEDYDSERLREEAEKYSLERFKAEMEHYIDLAVKIHEGRKNKL